MSDDLLLLETLQDLYGETKARNEPTSKASESTSKCIQNNEDVTVHKDGRKCSKASGSQVQLDNTDTGPNPPPLTKSGRKKCTGGRKWKGMGKQYLTPLDGQSNKGYLAVKAAKLRRCAVCDVLVDCQRDLGIHMRQEHPEELPFECSTCGKKFKWPSSVYNHMRIHTAEFVTPDGRSRRSEFIIPWTCVGCSRVFHSTRSLCIDVHPTTGEEILKCKVCKELNVGDQSEVINNKSAAVVSVGRQIQAPEIMVYPKEVGPLIPCSRCSLRFTTEAQRAEHYTNAHAYTCSLCGETFSGKEVYLKLHLKTHTLPYKCESCGERFPTEAMLQIRVSKNTGEKRYRCQKCRDSVDESVGQCRVCGESFDLKSNLLIHLEMKHPELRPFKCTECGKAFGKRGNLTNHQRLHTMDKSGERPFKCSVCGKAYRWQMSLSRHEKLHLVEVLKGKSP